MPRTELSGWWTAPGLTSWTLTRWRYQRTSDKVSHYSIYRPRKDERLSRPSWLTCSGRFTHINGHPFVASRAYDRDSTPAEDRRSTNQLYVKVRVIICRLSPVFTFKRQLKTVLFQKACLSNSPRYFSFRFISFCLVFVVKPWSMASAIVLCMKLCCFV